MRQRRSCIQSLALLVTLLFVCLPKIVQAGPLSSPLISSYNPPFAQENTWDKLQTFSAGLTVSGGQLTHGITNGASVVVWGQHDPTISGTIGTAPGNIGGIKFGYLFQPVRWSQGPGGEPNYIDDTWHIGQNVGTGAGGVGRTDTAKPNLVLSWESKYYASSVFAQEFHLQGVTSDGLTTFRPWSVFIAHDASVIQATIAADKFSVNDKAGNNLLQVSDADSAVDLTGVALRFAINNVPAIQQKKAGGSIVDLLYLNAADVSVMSTPLYVVGPRAGAGAPFAGAFVAYQPTTANAGDTAWYLAGPSVTGAYNGIISRAQATTVFKQEFNNQGSGDSQVYIGVEGAGDPNLKFEIFGGSRFTMGIDNSDSDVFKISTGAALGSGDILGINYTTGNVGIGTTAPASLLDLRAGDLTFSGANGQKYVQGYKTELTTIAAAATTTTTITIPANAILKSVGMRVTVQPPGTATMVVTATTSGTVLQQGANMSTAINTTDVGTRAWGTNYVGVAAQTITITPNAVPSDATGRVRFDIYYDEPTAPTS